MSAKARPTSARSTTAWGDYGNARPDSQFDFGQDGIRDEPDLSPTAMEDDSVYMSGNKSKSSAVATSSKNESKSCLAKIGGGIRSLWATRQTEDVKGDRELHVKTTLRELIIYIVFLVILCIVTFGMTQTTMYYYTKVMSDLFLDKTHSGGGSFRTITSVEDFWKYAKDPLINGLYWETWYNNQTVPDEQLGYIYYENKLLGVPRLRQLQVHSNSCVVHKDFKDVIRECYESYAESLENKKPFGPSTDNYTAWFYRTQDELDGTSHWGKIATYSGAGYVQDLTRNKSESAAIIDYLFDNRWIRRGTRVLFIDFTVYNANINLFCVIRLTVEFPPTGGAIPHATMRTVKLIRYVTVMDYFIMACEFILCLFILYYMIEEGIEIKKHKFSYFKSVWNILDILVIVIALVCVAFNVYRTIKVDALLQELLDKPDQYADFEFLSYGQTQFDNAIAIAVFLAWIKIFKYISFNKTMTQLSSTLGKCAKDLAGFAVMFFIIFLAFTQLGYLLFGTQVKDFSDFANSFFTLFRIILGDFDFDQLEAANRVLGPIFFMLFVFFVFFVLINMFLAIINDTYSEVKGDMANQKNEFEMGDYFKRGYEKMLSKLNFKHDKIVDIQKALKSADINNDKQVDFDEWRQDLKTRGYADGEIEALFAKYDIDGDRVLDEEEQKRMQADLNDQKAALSKEYDELDKIDRPESARRSGSRVSFNDDSADDSDDEDSHTKSSRSGPSQSVSYEEFTVLSRRVDRMEHSIGSIVSKIDAVLVKLEAMEKAKLKRRETMGKILDSITESDGTSDEVKREQMERLVREELERWDSESSITPQPSGRGPSPSSSGHGGARSRSRPGSGGNALSKDKVIGLENDLIAEVNIPETPLIGEVPVPDTENRLDQTEQQGSSCAQCEQVETHNNSAGSLGSSVPLSIYLTNHDHCLENSSKSLHNLELDSLPPSPNLQSVQSVKSPSDSIEHQKCSLSGNKEVRSTTPILPGIPSSSYSWDDQSSELQLSLPQTSLVSSENCIFETESQTLLLESSYRSENPNEHLARPSSKSSDRSKDLIEHLPKPSSKSSKRNNDSNENLTRPSSKSFDRSKDSNEHLPRPSSKNSDRSRDLNEHLARPSSESSDRSKDSNEHLPRPSSKNSERCKNSNEHLARPSSKSSDRSKDSNEHLHRPSSKSSDRSKNSNENLPRPSSESSDRKKDSNEHLPMPSSESPDWSKDSNEHLPRPSSKSSDRSKDSNEHLHRPSSESPDWSKDSNEHLPMPSSKSSDRSKDSNEHLCRPSSNRSDRSKDPKEHSPRPSSKSSGRSKDSNEHLHRPSSKSSDRSKDSNENLPRPASKSLDRRTGSNEHLPRCSSESSGRSNDSSKHMSRPSSESSDRNKNSNECSPRPSSESPDRGLPGSKSRLSRPASKSSDRSKDSNEHLPMPSSISSNRSKVSNEHLPRPSSKNSDRSKTSNEHLSRPSSKNSDRSKTSNEHLSRPSSKNSDRSKTSNEHLSRPSSKNSDRSKDLNEKVQRPASENSDAEDKNEGVNVSLSVFSQGNQGKESLHEPAVVSSEPQRHYKSSQEAMHGIRNSKLDSFVGNDDLNLDLIEQHLASSESVSDLKRPSTADFNKDNKQRNNLVRPSTSISRTALGQGHRNGSKVKFDATVSSPPMTNGSQVASDIPVSSSVTSKVGSTGFLPSISASNYLSASVQSNACHENEVKRDKTGPVVDTRTGVPNVFRASMPSEFSVINESKKDVDKVIEDKDAQTASDVSDIVSPRFSPKPIVTAKGQRVSMGTLSKMAKLTAKEGQKPNDVAKKSDTQTGIQTQLKHLKSQSTSQSDLTSSKIQNQTGDKTPTSHHKRHYPRSPERSAKTDVDRQNESSAVNLPPLKSQVSKYEIKNLQLSQNGIKENDKSIPTEGSKRLIQAKRPAPPCPVQHDSSTDSVDAQGKGSHISESTKHQDEYAVFV